MVSIGVSAVTSGSVNLAAGAQWRIQVCVRDAWLDTPIVDDPPVVTITLPDGTTDPGTVTDRQGGLYEVVYTVTAPGRYLASAVTASNGAVSFTAYVTAVTPAAGMPDLEALVGTRTVGDYGYLGETSATDDDVQDALDAEAAAQRSAVRVPAAYPADLGQALKRRVARNLVMRGLPVAVLRGDADGGNDTILPASDPEVRRYERPYRKLTMG